MTQSTTDMTRQDTHDKRDTKSAIIDKSAKCAVKVKEEPNINLISKKKRNETKRCGKKPRNA